MSLMLLLDGIRCGAGSWTAGLLDFAEVGRPHAIGAQCCVELVASRYARQSQPPRHLERDLHMCNVSFVRFAPQL